jgi:hypothetical protein
VEHRGGGKISVEKPTVSRETVEGWRFPFENGSFHVQRTLGVFRDCDLSRSAALEPLFEAV